MLPHPDFTDTHLPRDAVVGAFRLTPLSGAQVDEDYAVIKASEPVLKGLFQGSDWPADVTLASNLTDLHWHDREFTARRSFSWIIRNAEGQYQGCAYLFPDIGARGHGAVVTWMGASEERTTRLAAFNRAFRDWLPDFLPEGYVVRWTSNDDARAQAS